MKFRPKTAPHEKKETYMRPQAQSFADSYSLMLSLVVNKIFLPSQAVKVQSIGALIGMHCSQRVSSREWEFHELRQYEAAY